MKNDQSGTNHLASAKTSKYDSLQRRLSTLIQHWMDHASAIKPSRIVPLMCDYLDQERFSLLICNEEDLFSTKSDFYLGRIINIFIEIQDGEGASVREKRRQLESVLARFSELSHTKGNTDVINLGEINKLSTDSLTQAMLATGHDSPHKIKWWLKFINFLSKHR